MALSEANTACRWEIATLSKRHRRGEFACGVVDLDEYVRLYALQNDQKGIGRTYVVSPTEDQLRIAGYFTISVSSVACSALPEAMKKKLPRYPVPVVLLARLAVDQDFQGRRLGETLLIEALKKARSVSEIAGAMAVQVEALDDRAAAFYLKYGFVAMQDSPRTLFLSMKAVKEALSPT